MGYVWAGLGGVVLTFAVLGLIRLVRAAHAYWTRTVDLYLVGEPIGSLYNWRATPHPRVRVKAWGRKLLFEVDVDPPTASDIFRWTCDADGGPANHFIRSTQTNDKIRQDIIPWLGRMDADVGVALLLLLGKAEEAIPHLVAAAAAENGVTVPESAQNAAAIVSRVEEVTPGAPRRRRLEL
jgi:hypothetical protein